MTAPQPGALRAGKGLTAVNASAASAAGAMLA
jgi:hypothetical protein